MTRLLGAIQLFLLLIAGLETAAQGGGSPKPIASGQSLPKVLVIGDSISIGLTPFLAERLKAVAEVRHHKGNAEHTGTGLKKLEDWLGGESWDVIQFNWGLWDLCYRHPLSKAQGRRDKVRGTLTTSLPRYAANLEGLVQRLQATGAYLIFATTTVVPEGEAGRKRGDDLRYNEAALKVMNRHHLTVTDLNHVSRSFPDAFFVAPGNVHFTPEGYQALAKAAESNIREGLKSDSNKRPDR